MGRGRRGKAPGMDLHRSIPSYSRYIVSTVGCLYLKQRRLYPESGKPFRGSGRLGAQGVEQKVGGGVGKGGWDLGR